MQTGTNSEVMRENNKKLVLNLIRKGDFSRADIAKEIGLTKATLTFLADELLKEGIIYEENVTDYTGVGRRPSYLRLLPNSRYVIGLALSRSGFWLGLYDIIGNQIANDKFTYISDNAQENLENMAKLIESYKSLIDTKKLLGIGVASPGPLDYESGTILNPPNFEHWHNCEFSKILSTLCNLPVKVDNIANAMAVSERYFGCCKKEKDFAYIVVNEGIGSGIIVNEKIYRGHRGYGNELGHISIDYNGIECSCGNRGCLEKYASIPSILKGTSYKSWKDVTDNCDYEIIDKEIRYLSCGIVSLLNLFDLGTIILGDELNDDELLIRKLSQEVNKHVIVRHPVTITASKVTQRALAAASVALSEFFY